MIKSLAMNSEGRHVAIFGLTLRELAMLIAGGETDIDTSAPLPHGFGIEGGPIIKLMAGADEEDIIRRLAPCIDENTVIGSGIETAPLTTDKPS